MKDLSNFSDEQLHSMAVSGDGDSEALLISRYSRLVKACARPLFLAGGDSEDLIQEGMLGLVSAIRTYSPKKDASFKTYAGICIRRRLYTAIQTASRYKHTPLNDYVSLDSSFFDENDLRSAYFLRDMEEQVLAQESTDEINYEFSKGLSVLESEILGLFLEGLSYEEMALRVGKSPKSVDNAVQRIRKKLAQYLKLGGSS